MCITIRTKPVCRGFRGALFLKPYVCSEPKTFNCPAFEVETAAANCFTECQSDDECDNASKCCSTGCGRICVNPSEEGQGSTGGDYGGGGGIVLLAFNW